MDNGKKPWTGKEQVKSVKSVHEGLHSPLNKGHMMPLPKSTTSTPMPRK